MYADSMLENTPTKYDKYVVNQKLKYFNDISFIVGHSFFMKHSWTLTSLFSIKNCSKPISNFLSTREQKEYYVL